MFQIKNNQIVLNKSRVLTVKQLNTLKRIESENDKNRYLMSLMGLTKSKVYIPRLKVNSEDALQSKRPKAVLRSMEQLKRLNLDHTPNDNGLGQWVGVEIECIIPHQDGDCGECECEFDEDGNTEVECGYCRGGQETYWSEDTAHDWLKSKLRDAGVTRCNVKYDGSLADDEGHGVEVTILFNSKYGFEPLERLCSALTKAGCYVNKTCGLHVHLDARHLTKSKVVKVGHSIGNALPIIKWLVPASRHNNSYCELDVSQLKGKRYYAVNLTSYKKYKTIEVRLHSGSINASKIESWINLLKVVGGAGLKTPLNTFQDLIDLDGMSESLIEYAEKRITELNADAWPLLMSGPQTIEQVTQAVINTECA